MDDKQKKYAARKERERNRQAAQSRSGRDIGPIPPISDPELRARVSGSLRLFCELCLPQKFGLDWSPDHIEVLDKIQACIDFGQLYTLAMPRGSGKSTLVAAACLWAILTGRRKYVAFIAADKEAAVGMLTGIKTELEANPILLALFPEACYPIQKLDGKPNKAQGQLHLGKRTYIEWKGPRIVFPTIRENPSSDPKKDEISSSENGVSGKLTQCSGAIIECRGILGRIRGMNHTPANGGQRRPDLFVLDDPQTDNSAHSTTQTARRLNIITGAVVGLAGPDVAIAGFATVTVIAENDLADQLLDREKFPDWQGKRYQLVYKWPDRSDLWEQYSVIRAEALRVDGNIDRATAFYKLNKKEMDRGARVAWPARMKPGEISALQSAYNQKFRSPETFDAEFQNQPKPQSVDVELASIELLELQISNYTRGQLPNEANMVTAFVDVQGQLLYWIVVAWRQSDFSGWVLEYGTYPEQVSKHFSLRNAQNTLSMLYPKMGLEARIYKAATEVLGTLAKKEYVAPSGFRLLPQLVGIDQGWGPTTKTIQQVLCTHPRRSQLVGCLGKAFKLDRSLNDWAPKTGELKGDNWVLRPSPQGYRYCIADANAFKSFTNARLNVATGDPGSLSLYRPTLATEHRLICEHWRSEKPKTISDGVRSMEQWTLPPSKPDNHWWDGLYWSAVLASILGARLDNTGAVPRGARRKVRRKGSRLVT